MKNILLLCIVLISFGSFGQGSLKIGDNRQQYNKEFLGIPETGYKVLIDSSEYDYFAAYLVIQTTQVTDEQLEYTKKLMKYVKQNHGILYITVQSGTPPCIPTPGHPCPKK